MKYTAQMWVHLGYDVEVEADSREEANRKLEEIYLNMDFNEMDFGDGDFDIIAQHENVDTDVDTEHEMDWTEFTDEQRIAIEKWCEFANGTVKFEGEPDAPRRYCMRTFDYDEWDMTKEELLDGIYYTLYEWEKEGVLK